jgi:hypothetical protein
MTTLPLRFDELVELLRTCIALHPDNCKPNDLRDHLTTRLARSAPVLSGRVRTFDDRQMQSLCQFVRQAFELSGQDQAWVEAGETKV